MIGLTLDQALAELPDTADGIADRMRALGIKGKPHHSGCCPIAKFLNDQGFDDVEVEQEDVSLYDGNSCAERVETPSAVAEFVYRFDAGVYLDLVEVPSA